MSEPGDAPVPGELGALLEDWRSALAGVSGDETARARALIESGLGEATSPEAFTSVKQELAALVIAGDVVARRLRSLLDVVETLERDWVAAHRWEEVGLAGLRQELGELVSARPADAARRWLNELIDAFRARAWRPLEEIASWELAFPADLEDGAAEVRAAHAALMEGAAAPVLELWAKVAECELPAWDRILDVPLRSRAHRLASWIALRNVFDTERARAHLDRAVELDPYAGPNYAERAAFFLSVNDLDDAAADAQRAIELAPQDPAGYLQLGTWAELSGQFEDARELFHQALQRMSADAIANIENRAVLLDAPGSLLVAAADVLLRAGRPAEALEAADAAVAVGVRGAQAYPDGDAYRIRSLALEGAGTAPASDAGDAAVEAGKRYLWNGDSSAAIEQLRRGIDLGETSGEAGWLVADALSAQSFPAGAATPDPELLARARAEWEAWTERVGPPTGTAAWAYITRAEITSNETFDPERTTADPLWRAVADVERALVHDDTSGHWWGFAAKNLRAAGLEELAFEASGRAAELGSNARNALGERMALLANRGLYPEASAVASEIVETYGPDAWVSGVQAWLAYHEGRYEDALPHLDAPLAASYDLSWYYNLRAFCHLARGDLEAARADFRSTVASTSGATGTEKGELATANAALRDAVTARQWLERARDDATTSVLQVRTCELQVALAEDDVPAAVHALEGAVAETTNERELADLAGDTLLFLQILGTDESRSTEIREAAGRLVSDRTSWLAAHPVSPDTELADRLDELDAGGAGADLDPAQVALLAVAARRLARGGDLDGAAEVYERLRSSWFEPEAGIALARVLAGMSAAAVARGEVEQVRAIEQRRIAVGAVDSVAAGLAVAGALQADGRVDEARGEVAALLETADEAQREILHTRLGELALAEDDLEAARAAFSSALEIARNDTSGVSRVAQLETRLALVALVAGDDTAGPHVRAALEAWQEAGAFEPVWTLLEEARGLLASDTSKAVFGLAASALGALIKSFEADVDPDAVSSYLAGGAGSSNGEAAEGIPPGAV